MAAHAEIVILVAGEPVAPVRAARGGFAEIIARACGPRWSGRFRAIDARVEPLAGAAEGAEAILVTGSPASVTERAPWVLAAERFLAAEVARGTPILGLCFGHQLLAQALGGRVTKNPAGREIGTIAIDREGDDPLFDGIGRRFAANASHSDTVAAPPPGAQLLARSAKDRHQCVRFAPRCYGVQFHPEFDGELMRGYLEARAAICAAEGLDVAKLRAEARDTPDSARVLANFLAECVGTSGARA